MKKKAIKEPAIRNYFFGDSYADLGYTIKRAFELNNETIQERKECISDSWVLDGILLRIIKTAMNLIAIFAVCLFGTLYTVVLSSLHIICLLIFMIIFYFLFSFMWLLDRLYLLVHKVSHVCTKCHEHFLFPVYKCPNCGRYHWHLTPGVFGTSKRRCICGELLPCTFFIKVNGRKRGELGGVCPVCLQKALDDNAGTEYIEEDEIAVSGEDSFPIVVPVGGGRSAGKSVFINSFVYDFIDRSEEFGFITDPIQNAYSKEMKEQFKRIKRLFLAGSSERTERAEMGASSVRDFSFFVNHKKFSVPRVIHMLDVDGESFVANRENELSVHFRYCKGAILIIDPFTIPGVYSELSEAERGRSESVIYENAGMDTLDIVLDSFVEKIRAVLALSQSAKIHIPLAVCIGKIDLYNLEEMLGRQAVEKEIELHPEQYKNYEDAMNHICKKFLELKGESGFLLRLDTVFDNVRFFSFTAIGHAYGQGRYSPRGVMDIMRWFLSMSDGSNSKTWNSVKDMSD